MGAVIGLFIGLLLGFIAGWLIRDTQSRPLVPPGDQFGIGVPDQWHRNQQAPERDSGQPGTG